MLELLLLINSTRITPLSQDRVLNEIATVRAVHLCDHEFSHKGWLNYGSTFLYRGENLAKGFSTFKDAHEALMKSPTHKNNIVSSNYQKIGIAYHCGILVEEFGGSK